MKGGKSNGFIKCNTFPTISGWEIRNSRVERFYLEGGANTV
jgi:hypothetical protein